MTEFALELKTKIYFGEHITREALLKERKSLKGAILLISSGVSLKKYGYIDQLINTIHEIAEEVEVVQYARITPNPKLEEVKEAVRLGSEKKVSLVIGFGGGSALDAAKAAAVGIANEDDLEDYLLGGKEPTEKTLPIIAIPTTAGTGSELSRGAILTSQKHGVKAGIRGEHILPKIAIVDPVFTWTVPKYTTMETGFDVLAHAIESYVAVKANCFSEMLSEKAIEIIGNYLPELADNLNDQEARKHICFASMIMGINLANVGTCLPHRIQYAIGAKTDTSHAAGLVSIYPAWVNYEFDVSSKKINRVLELLGYQKVCGGEQAKEAMQDFIERLQIQKSLSDLGIEKSDIDETAGAVTGNLANDRVSEKQGIIKTILMESV